MFLPKNGFLFIVPVFLLPRKSAFEKNRLDCSKRSYFCHEGFFLVLLIYSLPNRHIDKRSHHLFSRIHLIQLYLYIGNKNIKFIINYLILVELLQLD